MFMLTGRPRRLMAVAATAGTGLGLLGAAPAHAADPHGDRAVVNCPAENLQTAINNAPAGSTLRVSGHCVGPFTINKNLTLTGVDSAVLDGNHAGSTVTITGAVTVKLNRLRIIGGRANPTGGGIRNIGATVTVSHSEISENTAAGSGGGIRNEGTLTLDDSIVRHNIAGTLGGGIDNLGPNGRLIVTDSSIQDNTATTVNGGGLFNDGTASLTRSVVEHNSAVTGGGIRNTGGGTLTLSHTEVRFNLATDQGGGLANAANSTATLRDSKVHDNTAQGGPGSGGGIRNDGTVTLIRTTVRNNFPENCAPPGSVPGCTNSTTATTAAAVAPPQTLTDSEGRG
ncbi:hypothetical protein [Streptomyces sp. NPDC046727]|uniref:hypothetical protein n=1 Tax=Streptomyces sp. NPDC046727 TaxID=3155373 RepID=UPI0033C7391D